jgi:uncharacterized protein (DUF4415 family)
MSKRDDDVVSRPDPENPEWTRDEMRNALPALTVIGDMFGATAAEALRRGPGRPPKPDRKVNQTLRLDADVLEAYRRQGPGWQTHMNDVLRTHMPERPK